MEFESWLTDTDIQRLWDVCHGNLPELAATEAELNEFNRCVTHAAMQKMAGKDYLNHSIN